MTEQEQKQYDTERRERSADTYRHRIADNVICVHFAHPDADYLCAAGTEEK